MSKRTAALALTLLATGSLVLAACSSSPKSSGTTGAGGGTKTPYTIGVDADFSGPFAYYGGLVKSAWNAAFDAVNSAGGIDGHKVVIKYLDDASVPTTVVANAKELVDDGVLLVRSDPDSDSCAEIYTTTKAASIPLQCEALAGSQLNPPEPFLYSSNVPETLYIPGVYKDIVSQTNSSPKIAEMIVDVVGETEWAARMKQEVQSSGGSIATDQLIPPTNLTNISSQTAAVLASHPDAVLTEVPPSTTVSFIKALRQGGFTGPVYSLTSDYGSMTTTKDQNFFETWPATPVQSASQSSGAATYIQNMQAVGVTGIANVNAGTINEDYLSAEVVIGALKTCGNSCTAGSLNTALETTVVNDPGVTLPTGYGYSAMRHYPLEQFALYHWSNSASTVAQSSLLAPSF